MRISSVRAAIVGSLLALCLTQTAQASSKSITQLIAESPDSSASTSLSQDGTLIAFSTAASLVSQDTNAYRDVYLYNRLTKTTTLISTNAQGIAADHPSDMPSISADGRYIAYLSEAHNLPTIPRLHCGGPTTLCRSIVVYDRQTNQNALANRKTLGTPLKVVAQGPKISSDGKFVLFLSDTPMGPIDNNERPDLVMRDMQSGVTRLISVDDNGSTHPGVIGQYSLSKDGRYVSLASTGQLAPGGVPGVSSVFLRDVQMMITDRIRTGATSPDISSDGRFMCYTANSGSKQEVMVYDVLGRTSQLVSVSSRGAPGNNDSFAPHISRNGDYITYTSTANNLVRDDSNGMSDIFLHYRLYGLTRRVNKATGDAGQASGGDSRTSTISGDGSTIAFLSRASNVTPGTNPASTYLYTNYNPVLSIPYYDPNDWLDLIDAASRPPL